MILWGWILLLLLGCTKPQSNNDPLLFADDFSDPHSGWQVWTEDESFAAYLDGGLRLLANRPQYDYWSLIGRQEGDVILVVKANVLAGPLDNRLGLICRYQDAGNYYAFLMSSDGYVGILRFLNGELSVLSAPTLEYRSEIRQGLAVNLLQADCVGDRLTLWVNQQPVAEAHDQSFAVGDMGVWVGSGVEGGVDVLFDDFLMLRGGK
jgi:hypothetical protein